VELKNIMEDIVAEALDELRKHYDFCNCKQCRQDICAIALNKISPRYVVSNKGASYIRADLMAMQKDLDILGVVLEAVKIVRQSPRH